MKPVQCETCRHFPPDANNSSGMGRCMHPARHGYFYPNEKHRCADHNDKPDAARHTEPAA